MQRLPKKHRLQKSKKKVMDAQNAKKAKDAKYA